MIQQQQLRHHHDNNNTNHSQTTTLSSSSILQKQEQYSGAYSALSSSQGLSLSRRSNMNDNNYHQNDENIMAIKSCLCSKSVHVIRVLPFLYSSPCVSFFVLLTYEYVFSNL
mmetsp:Transcript_10565/g.11846  ORF Transcript_10565/g.11846 Transcript_10565/m.11846 type:complete len:112 (-) Transcript_10565:271-606(-)